MKMTRTFDHTVNHAAFLKLKKDGTMILPASGQEIVFDFGILRFNLVQDTGWNKKILSTWKVSDVVTAQWY